MKSNFSIFPILGAYMVASSCISNHSDEAVLKGSNLHYNIENERPNHEETSNNRMILIRGGAFAMGGDGAAVEQDELPKHTIIISDFWIDEHEVTNEQFSLFISQTGYITTAERKPDWEQLKKQLPPGTPKPPDSLLVPSSLVFTPPNHPVQLDNYSSWWSWVPGANWRRPGGMGTDLKGKGKLPVVHVSWEDASAYCRWSGKQLPTEAQWEYASRGGLHNAIYPWGDEQIFIGLPKANTWDGDFPYHNTNRDGYKGLAPVKSFAPNGYQLFDMAGNVWEWCQDWYRHDQYQLIENDSVDPIGPEMSYDPQEPYSQKKVTRGGSFMCNESYCTGYRVSRRMKTTFDSSMSNLGFRCVRNKK